MANYILRKCDNDLWQRVKVRAVSERMSVRAVLLVLLEMYAGGLRLRKEKAK